MTASPTPARRASDRPLPPLTPPQRDFALERALAHDQVDVLFQPQFALDDGRLTGVEALARIDGAADAGDLFRRAEAARLSERLSRHVQRLALRAAAEWSGPLAGLPVAINLLPQDIARPGYADWLLGEIAAAGIAAARVTAEITEQALIADPDSVAERLARLREAGIRVALDDFGTGYANLANLARLPLDCLKIDRSLIARLESSGRDRLVVRAIFELARKLGLETLVEGVESAGQLTLLRDWGCERFQGFLGARPMSAAQLAAFAAARA